MRTLLFLICILPSLLFAQKPVNKMDYAFGIPITLVQKSKVYQFNLPLTVYQHATSPLLSDVRVFDNQGHSVPTAIIAPERVKISHDVELRTIPVLKGPQSIDQLNFIPVKDDQGKIIAIRSNETNQYLSGYLIETNAIANKSISSIHVNWTASTNKNQIDYLSIAASNDLKNWRVLPEHLNLIQYRNGNTTVRESQLKIKHIPSKYIFIFKPSLILQERISKLTVNLYESPPKPYIWTTPNVRHAQANQYAIDTGGSMPIEAMNILYEKTDTVAKAQLYSRESLTFNWQLQREFNLYNVELDDANFTNAPIPLAYNPHRYWLLRIVSEEAPQAIPTINVAWRPNRVLFIPSGEPPYLLAYGSRVAPPRFTSAEAIWSEVNHGTPLNIKNNAKISTPITLAGKKALTFQKRTDWQKILRIAFWLAVLGAVIFFLTKFVLRKKST